MKPEHKLKTTCSATSTGFIIHTDVIHIWETPAQLSLKAWPVK